MTTKKLTGGQMVVDILIREGVEKVFAIPGHGNTALLDAFVDRADEIELVPAMHEQGAAHMADGYYRASGKVAAVCTSIGPGATNTLTGLATAYVDSQPLLLLTGAVHTYMENYGVLQEIDRKTATTSRGWPNRASSAGGSPTAWSRFPPRSHRPSTPCTKAAAGRCSSTSPKICKPNTASTHRRQRACGVPPHAPPATPSRSPRPLNCWPMPSAR